MIEFNDLTPWSLEETQKFYDLEWYVKFTAPSDKALGFQILEPARLFWEKLVCMTDLPANMAKQGKYTRVCCLLRNGHKGDCMCYHPVLGIISLTYQDLTNLADAEITV